MFYIQNIFNHYFLDHGLLSLFLAEPGSALLETVVYNRLKKEHKEGIFYLRANYEVDFFIPGRAAVQVAWSLTDQQTRTREFSALHKASEAYEVNTLQVVTWSEEERLETGGHTIDVIPVWKWLLS